MSASQAVLPPPNSKQWFEHPPEVVYKKYQGRPNIELLIYISLGCTPGEMKTFLEKLSQKPVSENLVTKNLSNAIKYVCFKRKINYIIFRESYDKTRSWYKAYRQGKRGDELENGVKAHHTHKIIGHSGLSDNPTLQELKLVKQSTAPIDWWLKMVKFLETYSDDKDGLEKLRIDWGHTNIDSTKNFKNHILTTTAAMEENESHTLPTVAVGDGQTDVGDEFVVVACQIFPSSNYVTKAAGEANFAGSRHTEAVENQDLHIQHDGATMASINTQAVTPTALKTLSEMQNRSISGTSNHHVAMTAHSGSYTTASALRSDNGVGKRKPDDEYAGLGRSSKRNKQAVGQTTAAASSGKQEHTWETYAANPTGYGTAVLPAGNLLHTAFALGLSENVKNALGSEASTNAFLQANGLPASLTASPPVLAPVSTQLRDTVGSSSSAPMPIPPPSHAAKRPASLAAPTSMPSQKRLTIRDTTNSSSSSAVPNMSPLQATGRKSKKMAKPTVTAQPLHTPEGMLNGNDEERRAMVALDHIRLSLGPEKHAVLTSPDILLTTFDPLHDKFEGLGESWTTKGNFYYLCEYTTIFRNPDAGSKDVDNFVAWFMEGFLDGPKTSGTFIDGLSQALANMKERDEKRKTDEEADEEQFLLDSDAAEEVNPKFT